MAQTVKTKQTVDFQNFTIDKKKLSRLMLEIYEKYGGFDLSYSIAADFEFMLRLFATHHIRTVYLPHIMVKMRLGGTTNRNLKNILLQNLEIRRALRSHNMSSSLVGFIVHKACSRFLQFIQRPQ